MNNVDLDALRLIVRKTCYKVDVDALFPEISLKEQGIDSLDMMSIYFALEDAYSIQISEELLLNSDWSTLRKILENVTKLCSSKY